MTKSEVSLVDRQVVYFTTNERIVRLPVILFSSFSKTMEYVISRASAKVEHTMNQLKLVCTFHYEFVHLPLSEHVFVTFVSLQFSEFYFSMLMNNII